MARDLFELLVAYGAPPIEGFDDARPAASLDTASRPHPSPGVRPMRVCAVPGSAGSGCAGLVVGLARAWSAAGRTVLLVDLDPCDDLARALLLGGAFTVDRGQLLLGAVLDEARAEPAPTLLPGVDLLPSGAPPSWDGGPLAHALARRPDALAKALAPWLGAYDRLLLHAPTAPTTLVRAAEKLADFVLFPVRWPHAPPRGLPPRSRVVYTAYAPRHPSAPVLASEEAASLLLTAIPDLPGADSPTDVVRGAGGQDLDEAFAALATELEAP